MFFRSPNLGLPRRVVAYYLLFCLVAIAWLSVGVLVTSHSVLSNRGINSCLLRLGKLTAALEIEYIRSGTEKLQPLIVAAAPELHASYCSIESTLGVYLAHSNPAKIGQKVESVEGAELHWGTISGVRYRDEAGTALQEFRTSLIADNQPFGALRIAIAEPTIRSTITDVARHAPIAILIPLMLVAIGALVLTRLTNPLTEVTRQLQHLASLPPSEPTIACRIITRDSLSLGWNRLIDLIERLQTPAGQQTLEERLQQATANRRDGQHADILENLADGVALTDAEGRIAFCNRAIASLLGEEVKEGSEIEKWLAVDEKNSSDAKSLIDPQLSSRAVVSELHRTSGTAERFIRVSRQPVKQGRLQGQIWCLRDVTQQKLAEKMRDQFIDTATHELRTPLSNIKAYAETMITCNAIDVEEQKEFCNIINSEVTRLARFVDDLLSISSMEMGSLCIEKQKVDTPRLFTEVIDKVEPLMQQKNITFFADLPEKMRELRLDKDKFIAVIVNLLGNAAKYTPNGGRVTLRAKLDESHLAVAIEDSGFGIAADEIPKLFEKFFRSPDPRVQSETGTGLGLSLANEVIRMHGGEITVESVLNQGSTFTVIIPAE
jgi:PAS domain S-box-containing protein